jgi:hypothetical protein
MKPAVWIMIVSFIGLGMIIAAALYWKGPKKKPPLRGGVLSAAKPLPQPEELYPLQPGELDTRGVSPELLAQMEAAGMNTTHERWDDFESARLAREGRRGPKHALAGELRSAEKRKPARDVLEENGFTPPLDPGEKK